MFEGIGRSLSQFGVVFQQLTPGKKIGVVLALVVVIGGFAGLLAMGSKPTYEVLFSNLSQEDAAQVVEKLREMRIEYELAASGTAVLVPGEAIYETRLALAGEGLPRGGGVGFEIFDQTKIGATEFMQRINYQRALQGELARTIDQFQEVQSSRVHIVTPKESLFIEESKPPSAAVILKLYGAARLSQSKVQAVVNLVASSVEGLEPENITVVDTRGRVLYAASEEGGMTGLSDSQRDYQIQTEEGLVKKIQALLDKVVGPGKSSAKVSAEINFHQEQLVEESYDPDISVIRSSQSAEENQTGVGMVAAGSPDEQFKVTGPTVAGGGGEQSSYSRSSETVNYELNKINRQVVKAAGEIERLSVAVIIDGRYEETEGEDGQPVKTYLPRTEEELAQFTTLIRSAVGYNEIRGDTVHVSSMPFESLPEVTVPPPALIDTAMGLAKGHGRAVMIVFLVALFFMFVVRPMLRWTGRELKEVMVETAKLPPPSAEGEAAAALIDFKKKIGPKDQAVALAEKEPGLATDLIKSWLHEGEIRR